MRRIRQTSAFRRDLKRVQKRGKSLAKLYAVVEALALGCPLEPKHKPNR
jgi:mRNA-degrading endonuclease YafQ of YafQ-DinJ toxin-antitoxin module